MTLFWTRTWDALASAVFPTPCVCCKGLIGAHDPPLCPACWQRLPPMGDSVCRCGAPLPGSRGEECGRCRRGRSPLSRGASLGLYGGPLRDCVIALKYHGRHRTAERLAVRMIEDNRCRALFEKADLAIPVPLHPGRLGTRGFNQADLLATALARGVHIARADALARVRDTPSQTSLSVGERRRNVRNAFKVTQSRALDGAVVVLVDDVMTTGATLRECASTLLASGVREVRSITVARAE